jgi:GTP-binding protein
VAESNFVDYVKIMCRSGKGGAGAMHFHRDKNTAFGGPDGGDGGRGGHIILKGNAQLSTLLHLKYRKHVLAENGANGEAALRKGKDGKDDIIEVPLGTVAKDADSGDMIFEITEDGEEKILVPGGRGGMGNHNFKSATRQTPRYAQPGEEGQEQWIVIELKLLADIGLVGFPNAGKSTLLSVISAAKPEIADYPFTTIVPNLGIVKYHEYQTFVVADIPGIIEGAHSGKGLGTRFLRHIERNATLLFMIPSDTKDIAGEYKVLLRELELYNRELLDKKRLLAITKTDLIDDELQAMLSRELPKGIDHIFISAATGKGIKELKDKLWRMIRH